MSPQHSSAEPFGGAAPKSPRAGARGSPARFVYARVQGDDGGVDAKLAEAVGVAILAVDASTAELRWDVTPEAEQPAQAPIARW